MLATLCKNIPLLPKQKNEPMDAYLRRSDPINPNNSFSVLVHFIKYFKYSYHPKNAPLNLINWKIKTSVIDTHTMS